MKTLIDFADSWHMLPTSGLVLCAVSGGTDSMCLLCTLREISSGRGFSVAAMHFEHGIRGADSVSDAEFVRGFCDKNGIPFYLDSGNAVEYSKTHSCGLEEAARILRYDFFYKTLRETGAVRIATAHNADDNAETIIMNLTRGSGLAGLSGIPPVRGPIIRPLLAVSRHEIEDYMEKNGIPHVEDATNADTAYTRNRIRHNVIPILKDINPALCSSVMNTSIILRQDNEYLETLSNEFIDSQAPGSISIPALLSLPKPVSSRVLRQFSGVELSYERTQALFALCRSGSPSANVNLPGGGVLRREYDCLLKGAKIAETFSPFELTPGSSVAVPELGLKFSCEIIADYRKIYKSLNTFFIKYDSIYGAVCVRPRKPGDKISLSGRNCTKSLKKLFIESRIPEAERELIPVFTDSGNKILAVMGFGTDSKYSPLPGGSALKIQTEEIN